MITEWEAGPLRSGAWADVVGLRCGSRPRKRRECAAGSWSSYQAVQTSTGTVKDSAALLDIAQHSFTAAGHRYQAGVGNILELLNAQAALSNAKQQHVQALTDWRAARLRLAGSLGRLGMSDTQ
jgi:outer membrane protein